MSKCIEKDCSKRATFNYDGLIKGVYCAKHKSLDMIDVKHKKCLYDGCKTRPSYNIASEKIPIYCVKHKLTDMIDIKSKRCVYDGCKTGPNYNFITEKLPMYCAKHKLVDMVDIRSKRCIYDGCKTGPSYNFITEKLPIYCIKHKHKDMIDIISKRCIYDSCKTRPSYNIASEKIPIYCVKHKLTDMIDIRSKRCIYDGCKTQPSYNIASEKIPIYCIKHKLVDMVDIKHKTCKTYLCPVIPTTKYDGYCFRCFVFIHPDKPVVRNLKTKEKHVVDELEKHYGKMSFIWDKTISCGESRYRPDILFILKDRAVIVEIDENQHKSYDKSCIEKRETDIMADIALPTIFIRFNPDSYTESSTKHPSCFGSCDGIYKVVAKYEKNWNMRIKTLISTIDTALEKPMDTMIAYYTLFYDC